MNSQSSIFYIVGSSGPTGPTGANGSTGPTGPTGPTGIVSIGFPSSSGNINGATIMSGVLSLSPATSLDPGIVTTGPQAFSGSKTFTDTTSSTSPTTGCAVFNGGIGVNQNINLGGSITSNTGYQVPPSLGGGNINYISYNTNVPVTGNIGTSSTPLTLTVERIGHRVMMYIPSFTNVASSTTNQAGIISNLPSYLLPSNNYSISFPYISYTGGSQTIIPAYGIVNPSSSEIIIFTYNVLIPSGDTITIGPSVIEYMV